jgi:hypothetical protein
MAAVDLLAGTVMDKAASLMNDTVRTIYTYTAQVPYLQMALQELREHFELHSIPCTQQSSAVISIPVGTTQIIYNGIGVPKLPDAFVEPLQLWERPAGIDPYIPMHRRDFIPHNLEGIPTGEFIYFTWNNQVIEFLPANRINEIKLDYIQELFTPIVDENSLINVVNASTFLEYRTAGLLAEFIERNLTSSNALNAYAALGIDRATGIGVKSKQIIMTRRRPFRAGYKKRGWMT